MVSLGMFSVLLSMELGAVGLLPNEPSEGTRVDVLGCLTSLLWGGMGGEKSKPWGKLFRGLWKDIGIDGFGLLFSSEN